jgi:hypothetical protein
MKTNVKSITLIISCSVLLAFGCNPEKNNTNGPVYNDNKESSSEMKDSVSNINTDRLNSDSVTELNREQF